MNTMKTALSGGIAGFVGTLTLFPLDCAKTVKQADPSKYRNVFSALRHKVAEGGVSGVYRGCVSASLSAIPSSALYFGAYEITKTLVKAQVEKSLWVGEGKEDWTVTRRLRLHACGEYFFVSRVAYALCESSLTTS